MTGSSCGNMKLDLFDKDDKLICKLDNDDAMLGSYPVEDGMRIHVCSQVHFHSSFFVTSRLIYQS